MPIDRLLDSLLELPRPDLAVRVGRHRATFAALEAEIRRSLPEGPDLELALIGLEYAAGRVALGLLDDRPRPGPGPETG
jgi:hypothetical protein